MTLKQKIIDFAPLLGGSSHKRQPAKHSKRRGKRVSAVNYLFFFPTAVFFMECVLRVALGHSLFNFYTLMFSLAAGLLFVLIGTICSKKVNRIVTIVLLAVLTVLFGFHLVYTQFFGTVFSWSIANNAGNFTQFYREIFAAIFKNLGGILILCLPLVLYWTLGERFAPAYRSNARARVLYAVMLIIAHLLSVIVISLHRGEYGDNFYYRSTINTNETLERFGLITTTRIDFSQMIFGAPDEKVDKPTGDLSDITGDGNDEPDTNPEQPKEYVDQKMDIDFDALIAGAPNNTIKDMHEYFAGLTPTKTNDYTGMFEGKNLIFLTLEGFCDQFIDPELTPTLYKMATEGFVFENFYTSVWGGSTATGEYAAVTGNFYNNANCLKMSGGKTFPFTMGNQFRKEGYLTLAYHNHTFDYYGRDKSHPNFGYTYKAIGNGLNMSTNSWPRSDLEMAQATIEDYINSDKPFHAYYMTVSGHAYYTFTGNSMSKKHQDRVAHLPYSENVRAYIACQLEVEDMLTELVNKLDKAGKLEDTVFAMSADHFPYALSDEELAELYDLPLENIQGNFDLYRNGFILWSAGMEKPIRVTKPASSIDIIPTLSNLFGLEYDSRLLMGTDILSTTDPVVVLNCNNNGGSWHWITPYGSYNTKTKTFKMADGVDWDETKQNEYVRAMNAIVSAKRAYSLKILDNDYYKYVFK